jgi:hypothetical protein
MQVLLRIHETMAILMIRYNCDLFRTAITIIPAMIYTYLSEKLPEE